MKSHDNHDRFFFSYVEEMIHDSEKDELHEGILLDLAETFLKTLLQFYENERFNCLVGYSYQKLGWIKLTKRKYRKAEKMFLYSIINLQDCKNCKQELFESYIGLTRTYIVSNKLKKAKKIFISSYELLSSNQAFYIEEDIDFFFTQLNITPKDLLKKR